jgi:hypothetical protein
MKPITAVAFLALSTGLLHADAPTTVTVPAAPGGPSAAKVANPTPAAPAKPPVKKEEPMGKITGAEIARTNGTFLGLEVVDGVFKLSFYNKKKKPMPVDVTRATARWPNLRLPHENHSVLNPAGNALVGQNPVVPPFAFNVFITLLQGEGDDAKAVETYMVPFHE